MYSIVIWVACKRNRQKDAKTAKYNTRTKSFILAVEVVVAVYFLLRCSVRFFSSVIFSLFLYVIFFVDLALEFLQNKSPSADLANYALSTFSA